MTSDAVDRLLQEMTDNLDAGSVGLYEFVDELNDPDEPTAADQREAIARLALERMIARGGVEIQWRRWGDFDNLGTVAPADLPADAWRAPDSGGKYLAVVRT